MAAKLGADVTMVTKLGRDIFGDAILRNYEDRGIDTGYIFRDDESPTGVASILVDDDGENVIVIVPGANFSLSTEDVHRSAEAIGRSDILLCQLEIPLESTIEALKIAKDKDVTTILNPAPFRPLPDEIFDLIDIFAPNRIEAEMIGGMKIDCVSGALDCVANLAPCETTIITLGRDGAVIKSQDKVADVPTISIDAVDSTGAGDAFIGALAYFITILPIEEAVLAASVAGALSATRIGTQTSFPSIGEIEAAYVANFGEIFEDQEITKKY
jgi:ribokinase